MAVENEKTCKYREGGKGRCIWMYKGFCIHPVMKAVENKYHPESNYCGRSRANEKECKP